MRKNFVRMPFDVEMAKKIMAGEIPGRVLTMKGERARIVCWDYKDESGKYPILALIEKGIFEERCLYTLNGKFREWRDSIEDNDNTDLTLEVPEYMSYKDGDIIRTCNNIVVIKSPGYDKELGLNFKQYVSDNLKMKRFENVDGYTNQENIRMATEEERNILAHELKERALPDDVECQRRFLGIEFTPKEKEDATFKPKDWVLCYGNGWNLCRFSHTTRRDVDGRIMYVAVGGIAYEECIPYEGNEHLIGTKKMNV